MPFRSVISRALLFVVLAALAAGARSLTAQTVVAGAAAPDTAGVRRAVLDYLEGFYEGDTAKLVRSVRADVSKYGFWMPKDSTRYTGEAMPFSEFLSYARGMKARNRRAPETAPREITLLDVQDQTANAKLRAWWGTDYLLLARFDGRWMITHVLWQSPQRTALAGAR
jgi:hypothetical protein